MAACAFGGLGVVCRQHLAQVACLAAAQQVGKQQHRPVGHGLVALLVKQAQLPAEWRHRHSVLVHVGVRPACAVHKVNGRGKLLPQAVAAFLQRAVVRNLAQRHHHGLLHVRLGYQLTHRVGRALERLADEHVLYQLLASGRKRIAGAQFGQLHLVNHPSVKQPLQHLVHRLAVGVEVRQLVVAAYGGGYATEHLIGHRLAKFHRSLGLALPLLRLGVEARECGCVVGQRLVGHKHHARVLHRLNLLGREAVHLAELLQVVHIRLVSALLGGYVARHRAVVARKHHAVLAHNHGRLHRAAVVVVGHFTHHALRVLVAAVVAVVHTLAVLVHGETLGGLEAVLCIVARCGSASLCQHVVAAQL